MPAPIRSAAASRSGSRAPRACRSRAHAGLTGTYTGSRVGTAQLTGRQVGTDFDLAIEWPRPLYGDTTAKMRIASIDSDRFRIVVTDRIGTNGPVRATTDLTLLRQ